MMMANTALRYNQQVTTIPTPMPMPWVLSGFEWGLGNASQVPQPTCFWKLVGRTIPKKLFKSGGDPVYFAPTKGFLPSRCCQRPPWKLRQIAQRASACMLGHPWKIKQQLSQAAWYPWRLTQQHTNKKFPCILQGHPWKRPSPSRPFE